MNNIYTEIEKYILGNVLKPDERITSSLFIKTRGIGYIVEFNIEDSHGYTYTKSTYISEAELA